MTHARSDFRGTHGSAGTDRDGQYPLACCRDCPAWNEREMDDAMGLGHSPAGVIVFRLARCILTSSEKLDMGFHGPCVDCCALELRSWAHGYSHRDFTQSAQSIFRECGLTIVSCILARHA